MFFKNTLLVINCVNLETIAISIGGLSFFFNFFLLDKIDKLCQDVHVNGINI